MTGLRLESAEKAVIIRPKNSPGETQSDTFRAKYGDVLHLEYV